MTVNGVRHALEVNLQAKLDIRKTIAQGLKNDAVSVFPLSLFSYPLSPRGREPGVRGLVLTLSFPTFLIGNPRPG